MHAGLHHEYGRPRKISGNRILHPQASVPTPSAVVTAAPDVPASAVPLVCIPRQHVPTHVQPAVLTGPPLMPPNPSNSLLNSSGGRLRKSKKRKRPAADGNVDMDDGKEEGNNDDSSEDEKEEHVAEEMLFKKVPREN